MLLCSESNPFGFKMWVGGWVGGGGQAKKKKMKSKLNMSRDEIVRVPSIPIGMRQGENVSFQGAGTHSQRSFHLGFIECWWVLSSFMR